MITNKHGQVRTWLLGSHYAWAVPAATPKMDVWKFNDILSRHRRRTHDMVWVRYRCMVPVVRELHAGKRFNAGNGTRLEFTSLAP